MLCLTPGKRTRPAFTLVELLIVIGIIGILAALLIPAVNKIRESSNRTACSNNIKQLSLALNQYHLTNGLFPMGIFTDDKTSTINCPRAMNCHYYILPYLDQANLFNQIAIPPAVASCGMASPHYYDLLANRGAADAPLAQPVRVMQCPSDYGPVQYDTPPDHPFYIAKGNYAPFYGGTYLADPAGLSGGGRSVLGWNYNIRLTEIGDGASNTAVLTEALRGVDAISPGYDQRGTLWSGLDLIVYTLYTPNTPQPDVVWRYTCPPDVNRPAENLPCVDQSAVGQPITHAARSRHPGGVNMTLADGAVRFVNDSIDLAIWQGLVTIGGNEIIGNDY
jgi:prepilin-type N-terminal cleavage/methylation domain-containing protein/prepilin-type processing-associated H-X9-DG protein